ncbi:hypothetical protein F4V57_06400 [Acinetobacter qingfengensis]|uniref:Uncharacterized protein n=1 Tax=Acinetobacter qingfengensis TaxID=1262585 RepID=A0A1E7RDM4_9GAMM|nr:GDSL-type esterase/lipase family protein [Acinetobacter qingfengensis]KAA8733684.1 hypothetical protein F4V57_06400 [Acinetobacter qingfengensis]OEY97500.1 hypothetical protein BJI46_09735 [Acinetobacter qingfengensis]
MKINTKLTLTALFIGIISHSTFANDLSNFNEPNTLHLIQALKNHQVHIVQFGDSHTAADVMTDALRVRLQQTLGNGGMGWGMPMYFTGQRLARYGYDNTGWLAVSSRSRQDENYTLGGFLAIPRYDGATLTIKAKQIEQPQKITVSLRQAVNDAAFTGVDANGRNFSIEAPVKNGQWQTTQFVAKLPFTITAHHTEHSAIAGWWAENESGQGVVVSALGINGAELSHWNRWNHQWQNEMQKIAPDLVILAYGTNEAYNNQVDVAAQRQILINKIRDIRRASPQSSVMLVSAPESLKSTAEQCGIRPTQLTAFQMMQKQVAQTEKTLFWDWQHAMGGNCSMKGLIKQGEARADGVHFTASAYQRFGQSIAEALLTLAEINPNTSSTMPRASTSNLTTGSATICDVTSNQCKIF